MDEEQMQTEHMQAEQIDNIVVIGGGVAGVAAAEAAHAYNPAATVTLVSEGGGQPRADLLSLLQNGPLSTQWALPSSIIQVRERVVGIAREGRLIKLASGVALPYDALVLATGSKPIHPENVEWPQLLALGSVADVERLRQGNGPCVVLGDGAEAVQIAWALIRLGREVTLVVSGKRLLERQLEREASHFFLRLTELAGVRVALNSCLELVEPGRVVLADSRAFNCTQAVVSQGRRATVNLAPFLALPPGRALSVDQRLATECARVWAAGECTDRADRLLDPVNSAREMGRVAGINAAGGELDFVPPVGACHFEAMGVEVWRYGEISGEDSVSRASLAESCLVKLFFDADRLVGAESISAHPAAYLLRRAVVEQWTKQQAITRLGMERN